MLLKSKIHRKRAVESLDYTERCPYCGGLVILNTLTGEYVCTNCGTVLDVLYLPPLPKYKR